MGTPDSSERRNSRLIWVGLAWVNFPVWAILIGGCATYLGFFHFVCGPARNCPNNAWFVVAVLIFALVPFAAAWLWWSVRVPKWRIWALERTDDWPALE